MPTGLGKTSCVLLALLAGLANPVLPRRVVFVIDRRAIVDQVAQGVGAWIERIAARPALAAASDAHAALPAERLVAGTFAPSRAADAVAFGARERDCGRWPVAEGLAADLNRVPEGIAAGRGLVAWPATMGPIPGVVGSRGVSDRRNPNGGKR